MYKEPIILTLDKYMVNIFFLSDSSESLDENSINELKNKLNSKEYPKDIIESMESLVIDTKIEILDKNNNILLSSENIKV